MKLIRDAEPTQLEYGGRGIDHDPGDSYITRLEREIEQ